MRSAAFAERERVEREAARLQARRDELGRELAAVEAAREELANHLRMLNRFVHDDITPATRNGGSRLRAVPNRSADPVPTGNLVLKGARIREAAVRVLAGSTQARSPVHYRTWFELFTREGFLPAGKDPVATFLTQVGRSPVVQRTSAAGTYQLDFLFPERARRRLTELGAALAAAQDLPVDAGVDDIAAARVRRTELTSEIQATERALEEALRSLGDKPD